MTDTPTGIPFVRNGITYFYTDDEYDALLAHDLAPIELQSPALSFAIRDGQTVSQAQLWLADVMGNTKPTKMRAGDAVAKALAARCGNDSMVRITRRKLTETVGGPRWFTDDGVRFLENAGWLKVETTGKGRGSVSTFYLTPGDVLDRTSLADAA